MKPQPKLDTDTVTTRVEEFRALLFQASAIAKAGALVTIHEPASPSGLSVLSLFDAIHELTERAIAQSDTVNLLAPTAEA